MAVNSSALQAAEWCNPGTMASAVALLSSPLAMGVKMVKWSIVCAYGCSLAGVLYMRVVCGCTHPITTCVLLTRLYGGALHYIWHVCSVKLTLPSILSSVKPRWTRLTM